MPPCKNCNEDNNGCFFHQHSLLNSATCNGTKSCPLCQFSGTNRLTSCNTNSLNHGGTSGTTSLFHHSIVGTLGWRCLLLHWHEARCLTFLRQMRGKCLTLGHADWDFLDVGFVRASKEMIIPSTHIMMGSDEFPQELRCRMGD